MTQPDFTKPIMDRVVRYERRRTRRWFLLFWGGVVALVALAAFTAQSIYFVLQERQTFTLFGVLQENGEVIRSDWRAVLTAVYYDLPRYRTLWFLVSFLIIIAVVLLTRQTRARMKRRQASIAEYYGKKPF